MGFFTSKEERVNDLMQKGLNHLRVGIDLKQSLTRSREKDVGLAINQAISYFDEVLKIDPTIQTALYHKGVALYENGEYLEAIKSFNKSIEIKPNSQAWIRRGESFNQLGNKEEALVSFNKALELYPDDLDNILSISDIFAHDKQYDKTLNIIDQYLLKHPDSAIAWYKKGKFLDAFGRDREAYECYKKSLEFNPTNIYPEGELQTREGKQSLKIFLRSLIESYERDQIFIEEVNKILILDKSEIMGKYLCNCFRAGKPARLLFNDNVDTQTDTLIVRHDFYPLSSIAVLTKDSLHIVYTKGYDVHSAIQKIVSIPLETVISVVTLKDMYGFENVFLIKHGKKERYFRIKKEFDAFYDTLTKTIKIRREISKQPSQQHVHIDFSSIKDYLKNGGVVMQTFKCPGCGASLEFPDKDDSTTCQYCGNKIKAVDLFEKIKSLL